MGFYIVAYELIMYPSKSGIISKHRTEDTLSKHRTEDTLSKHRTRNIPSKQYQVAAYLQ